MSSTTDKYRGHADPTVASLSMKLIEAEEVLERASAAKADAAIAVNNARGAEESARKLVERLTDALDVLAGEPGVRVERNLRSAR